MAIGGLVTPRGSISDARATLHTNNSIRVDETTEFAQFVNSGCMAGRVGQVTYQLVCYLVVCVCLLVSLFHCFVYFFILSVHFFVLILSCGRFSID